MFADTEGSFLARRAEQIATGTSEYIRRKIDGQQQRMAAQGKSFNPGPLPTVDMLLDNIHVFRVYDHVEQLATIKALPAFLKSHPNVHLIIIDSVAFHFRRGFTDMGLRSRLLTGMAQELLHLANQHQLAVSAERELAASDCLHVC